MRVYIMKMMKTVLFQFKNGNMTGEMTWIRTKKEYLKQRKIRFV